MIVRWKRAAERAPREKPNENVDYRSARGYSICCASSEKKDRRANKIADRDWREFHHSLAVITDEQLHIFIFLYKSLLASLSLSLFPSPLSNPLLTLLFFPLAVSFLGALFAFSR